METSGGRFAMVVGTVAVGIVVVAAAVLAWALLRDEGGWPDTVPALSADELTKEPTDAWLTNGGTLSNQRYSPLDEIDTSNVGQLKGVWVTDLESATAAKYSAEAQPIFYNGMLYVPTGEDDVFAVDVDSGRIEWKYDSGISQKINTVCCGWLSRGVAIGEGKVFVGQLDGNLVALDQHTGEVAWKTQVGDWRKGYTITAAPLYYDGMVITGVSGGEFSIRGRVQAYDAETGKLVWRFHTIPGPGDEVGTGSWPSDNDSWRHGGAPMWQTPAVDPELGLLYFSTGNASPDLDGSGRAGDNLFAASIVALDARTGKHRWHFQQVRHDIWDYDAPSPTVLFDVEIDGETHKAIAETSKTGWTYVLDRETGKPLLPVEDVEVPQDPVQKTAATQSIPQYEPFISHDVTAKDVAGIRAVARATAKGAVPTVVRGRIFDPFGDDVRVIVPGPQGGTNWQPMSFSPETGYLYVCAMRSASGYSRSGQLVPPAKQGQVADLGSVFTTTGFGTPEGHFGAWDPSTGRIVWQKRWRESCYSGSVATAGGLVFVGRNNGALQAYDTGNGRELWSFQTGAGANTTATVFEHDGAEYVAFLAGGNALAATSHGANLWLFSLDGTMGPVKPGSATGGAGHVGEVEGGPPDAAAGRQVFEDNCSGCHGLNGTGGNGGPTLVGQTDRAVVERQVRNGGGGMPAFRGTLSDKEIRDVTEYVTTRVARR